MKKEKLGTNYLKDEKWGAVVSHYMLNDSARK